MRLMRGELLNPVFMAGNISKPFKICVQTYVSFLNNNEGKIGFIIEKNCVICAYILLHMDKNM